MERFYERYRVPRVGFAELSSEDPCTIVDVAAFQSLVGPFATVRGACKDLFATSII